MRIWNHRAVALTLGVYLGGLSLFVLGCGQQNSDSQTAGAGSTAKTSESTAKPGPASSTAAVADAGPSVGEIAATAAAEPPEAVPADQIKVPEPGDKPLLDGWQAPAFALLLSGEQHGYFEPCGCTATQSGGMSRRDDLLMQIKQRGWTVGGLDLGGLVKRSRRQSQIKFETMLNAMRDMGYFCTALGPQDLQLGADFLVSQHVQDPDSPESSLGFVAANVILFDIPELETPLRFKLFEINGIRVGVTAVLGESIGAREFPDGNSKMVRVVEAAPAVKQALADMKKEEPDLLILLSHSTHRETEALLKQFPGEFDVCVTAGGVEDPRGETRMLGDTLLVEVGHKGKSCGVLGFYPDSESRFRFELVNLDKYRFKDSMRMVEHMRYYQDRLKEEQLAGVEIPIRHPSPSGATFVGAAQCGECHSQAYEKWQETPHAQAFESLKHPRHGNPDYGITRIYDAECLACHVTGWEPQKVLRFESGFINTEFATTELEKMQGEILQGQQCESCHGPGSQHVALIEAGKTDEALAEVRVTLEQAKDRVCYSCHDVDNSPNFEFDKYWERVAHPWRD